MNYSGESHWADGSRRNCVVVDRRCGDAATTRSEARRQIRSDDAPLIVSQNNGHIFSKVSLSTPLTEILRVSGFPYAIHIQAVERLEHI